MTRRYNLVQIRILLTKGFSSRELRHFCYVTPEFRPIYHQLPAHSNQFPFIDLILDWLTVSRNKRQIVDLLVDWAENHFLIDTLLTWAKKHNPTKYEKYQPYYSTSPVYTHPSSSVAKSSPVPAKPPPVPAEVRSVSAEVPPATEEVDWWLLEEKSTPPPLMAEYELLEPVLKLRLDVAAPNRVILSRVFDLAVAIRQQSSPILAEDGLERVQSGEVQVEWPETEPYVHLRVHVESAECEIQGSDTHSFRLYRGKDSPIFYFQLLPKELGEIGIIVVVYQEDEWLGSARVRTVVRKRPAGKVKINVTSKPVETNQMGSFRKQLLQRRSNLLKLEEQAAIYGAGQTPLYLLNQIEAEQQAIGEIEAKLAELEVEISDVESG